MFKVLKLETDVANMQGQIEKQMKEGISAVTVA